MKLEELITQYEENRWIDCAWDDLNDNEEFESIMKYLKENKQLKEIAQRLKKYHSVLCSNKIIEDRDPLGTPRMTRHTTLIKHMEEILGDKK